MIAKVIRGPSFANLQSYLLGGRDGGTRDRVAWTSTRNLPSDDPELATQVMRATAEQSARVEKPVYHVILSLSPEEKLDRAAMLGVVERTLRDVGLHEHQALIVGHDDTRHHHVHVMVNRVHPETRVAWRTSHDYARLEKSLREQEREMGLREVPGRHHALPDQERHRGADLTSGDRRLVGRTGERPFAEHVREVVRADLREARSWAQLHGRLADYGLCLEKRGRGLAITDGERRVKASFVDRASSLKRLEERLGPYRGHEPGREPVPSGVRSERWRDLESLRRAAEGLVRHRDLDTQEGRYQVLRFEARLSTEQERRLGRLLRSRSVGLDRQLGLVYRDPSAARAALNRGVEVRNLRAVAQELVARPERFGALRGRGGLLPSSERRGAVEALGAVANALRDAANAQQDLDRQRASRQGLARAIWASRKTLRAARRLSQGPSERELAATAASLVQRVGMQLAARVLPPHHYQLLTLTLSLARQALHRAMDLGMEMAR